MKEMQKINQNIKHKHHNIRLRFSLDEEMSMVRAKIQEEASKDDQMIMDSIIGDGQTNSRQKLKVIKQKLESNDEKELVAKSRSYVM